MSESDDDRNVRERGISNAQVLADKDGAMLRIYKRCIREYCRRTEPDPSLTGAAILRSVFEGFKDKVSVYWSEQHLPRGRPYSSFIDYCRAHLFGLTSAVPCRKYANFHRKFEKASRVGAHLAIMKSRVLPILAGRRISEVICNNCWRLVGLLSH